MRPSVLSLSLFGVFVIFHGHCFVPQGCALHCTDAASATLATTDGNAACSLGDDGILTVVLPAPTSFLPEPSTIEAPSDPAADTCDSSNTDCNDDTPAENPEPVPLPADYGSNDEASSSEGQESPTCSDQDGQPTQSSPLTSPPASESDDAIDDGSENASPDPNQAPEPQTSCPPDNPGCLADDGTDPGTSSSGGTDSTSSSENADSSTPTCFLQSNQGDGSDDASCDGDGSSVLDGSEAGLNQGGGAGEGTGPNLEPQPLPQVDGFTTAPPATTTLSLSMSTPRSVTFVRATPPSGWGQSTTSATSTSFIMPSEITLWPAPAQSQRPDDGIDQGLRLVSIIVSDADGTASTAVVTYSPYDFSWTSIIPGLVDGGSRFVQLDRDTDTSQELDLDFGTDSVTSIVPSDGLRDNSFIADPVIATGSGKSTFGSAPLVIFSIVLIGEGFF